MINEMSSKQWWKQKRGTEYSKTRHIVRQYMYVIKLTAMEK